VAIGVVEKTFAQRLGGLSRRSALVRRSLGEDGSPSDEDGLIFSL